MKGGRGRYPSCFCCVAYVSISLALVIIAVHVIILPYSKRVIDQQRAEASDICLNRTKWYQVKSAERKCPVEKANLKQRLDLLYEISQLLTSARITHWLCYGTLWGVIRSNSLLDYDIDGDICILSKSADSVRLVLRNLQGKVHLETMYKDLYYTRDSARVKLIFFTYSHFQNDMTAENDIIRQGWDGFFVSHDCVIERFPERLVQLPLPSKLIDDKPFPVPREGHEIQMYFYPKDWFQIRKPEGCATT